MSERENGNGNGLGLPAWARAIAMVGIPGFIAIYLLGAIPGLPSPMFSFRDALEVHARQMDEHIRQTERKMHLERKICRGVWRGVPEMQEECDR